MDENMFIERKKIPKILGAVVLLCIIIIQTKADISFNFDRATVTYNLLENQRVTYVCEHGYNEHVNILERSVTDQNVENLVIEKSILKDRYVDRFMYLNTTIGKRTIHKLIAKNIYRNHTGYTYKCVGRENLEVTSLTIIVYYKPADPICIVDDLFLQCISEEAYPSVNMYIEGGTNYTDSFRNSTHIIKTMKMDNEIGVCTTYQNFPPPISSENNSCAILDPTTSGPTPVDLTTLTSLDTKVYYASSSSALFMHISLCLLSVVYVL